MRKNDTEKEPLNQPLQDQPVADLPLWFVIPAILLAFLLVGYLEDVPK